MKKIIFPCLILFLLISCSNNRPKESEEIILAKVGEKTISLNEFIRRAEYTIRPPYCRGNTNVHKKIILNSLIAEKMLALEAGRNDSLLKNEHFQRYLQGRREQAMRQWLFHNEIYQKIKLDPDEVRRVYKVAGRKYKIQYVNIKNQAIADSIGKMLNVQHLSFDTVFHQIAGLDSIPEREVEYNSSEANVIHEALYSRKLKQGQVIGPVNVKDSFLILKINGWTNKLALGEQKVNQRYHDVTGRLTKREAEKKYAKYVGKIMRGKQVVFSPQAFKELVKLIAPIYMNSENKSREMFLEEMFKKESHDSTSLYDKLKGGIDRLQNEPLLELDGQVWTVADFQKEIEIHPLVFRKKKMKQSEFARQFKLALVDMIRDKYIAKEAYKKGYDQVNVVKRSVEMWQDALLALQKKYDFLEKVKPKEEKSLAIIEKYLDPYIDELQKKYSDQIEVDVQRFNDVKLTRIDMFALQQNVPFPVVVPSFPQLTTDYKLDYGKKMYPEKKTP